MKSFFAFLLFFIFTNVFSQERFSVFFDSNKFDLKKQEITKLSNWILAHKEVKIIGVYGFCDEDGTIGFNDILAKKRIDFVFNAFNGKVKMREDFKTRSFGELHNLSKIKAENRKVTLFYILPKDFSHENEIIALSKSNVVPIASIAPQIPKPNPRLSIRYPEKLVFQNPDGTKVEIKLDTIFMKKVTVAKTGEKLKLENLNFTLNTFAIVNESRGKLYELLYVMQSNPVLKIEIQGHLCCVAVDRVGLSTLRAKAIKGFLVANNIDKTRISYKGFGSDVPIFPLPEKTENEAAANRRVEILIIDN